MFQRKSLGVLALSIGLGLATAASADVPLTYNSLIPDVPGGNNYTITYGTIQVPADYSSIIGHSVGAFIDYLTFHIQSITYSEGQLANQPFVRNSIVKRDIDDLKVYLHAGTPTGPHDAGIDLDTIAGSTADVKLGSGTFLTGDYYFKVTGTASGTSGGDYTYQATTAVPEADTTAMLMVGLGMVGFMARRRTTRNV